MPTNNTQLFDDHAHEQERAFVEHLERAFVKHLGGATCLTLNCGAESVDIISQGDWREDCATTGKPWSKGTP